MAQVKMIQISDVIKAGGLEAYAKKHKLKKFSDKISGTIKFSKKEWEETKKILKED